MIGTSLWLLLLLCGQTGYGQPPFGNGDREKTQLNNLTNLIQNVQTELPIGTLFILNRYQNANCLPQSISFPEIPVLRFNELAEVHVKKHFNHQALGMVCINEYSDIILLTALAQSFHHMRGERIIVWMSSWAMGASRNLLYQIRIRATLYGFLNLLVMDGTYAHRLEPFPQSHWITIQNIFDIKEPIFPDHQLNYHGMQVRFFVDTSQPYRTLVSSPSTGNVVLNAFHDKVAWEFAKQYSLKLEVQENEVEKSKQSYLSDLTLHSPYFRNNKNLTSGVHFTASIGSVSVIVVVPCGRGLSIHEVFKQIGLKTWFIHILIAYVAASAVETLIRVTTYRIFGWNHSFSFSNIFVNLRIFRAFLGLPYPVSSRASMSLRQILIAMSIFGTIFSSFFNSKLSALLTKHPSHMQVQNFDELRQHNLTVVFDEVLVSFIKQYMDAEFFNKTMSNAIILPPRERNELLYSLNASFGYQIFTNAWAALNEFQKSKGQPVLCSSINLTLMENLPAIVVIPDNSIYKENLDKYIYRTYSVGLIQHWFKTYLQNVTSSIWSNGRKSVPITGQVPLGLRHLIWLWYLLTIGYSLTILVFVSEIGFMYRQRSRLTVRRNIIHV